MSDQIKIIPTAKGFILDCGEGIEAADLQQLCYIVGAAVRSNGAKEHVGETRIAKVVYIKDDSVIVNFVLAKEEGKS